MKHYDNLEVLYQDQLTNDCPRKDKMAFLGNTIFNFTTYDDEMDAILAQGMIEVCESILDRTTFEYVKDKNNHMRYIIMINMPFLAEKIDWGVSVRGAWFDMWSEYEEDCGRIVIEKEEIEDFIREMIKWVKKQNHDNRNNYKSMYWRNYSRLTMGNEALSRQRKTRCPRISKSRRS